MFKSLLIISLICGIPGVIPSSVRKGRQSEAPEGPLGCPPVPECDATAEFRTADGSCNDLTFPLDGAAHTPFKRYLPPIYENGDQPRMKDLPTPRQVSAAISSVPPKATESFTSLTLMQWGQFTDHDFALTAEEEHLECCPHGDEPKNEDPECIPIDVTGDSFYSQFNITCLELIRSSPVDESCSPGFREQVNVLTAPLDGSAVYGSSLEEQHGLREMSGGRMRVSPGEDDPAQCDTKCPLANLPIRASHDGQPMYFGGDVRVQEQPGLTSMHTLLVRAHNGLAAQIARHRPEWDDERIFQEARRLNGAVIQHITYNEHLPAIVGFETAARYDILPGPLGSPGFTGKYDPVNIQLSLANVVATAFYRFGHTLISDVYHLPNAEVRLAASFRNFTITRTENQHVSDMFRGLTGNLAQRFDHFMVNTLTNKLFALPPDFNHGHDLLSRNIMRGREHGIPPYNDWRERFGLPRVTDFEDLKNVMPEEAAMAFASIYKSVDDIDVFGPAIAESTVQTRDGLAGPLLSNALATFFSELKFGDRFFYENLDGNPRPFTAEQLDVIRRTSLSALICDFTDATQMQSSAFQVPSLSNQLKDCEEIVKGTVMRNVDKLIIPVASNGDAVASDEDVTL